MKILLTVGCGFVGSVLAGALLDAGHDVTVVGAQWLGNVLPEHPHLAIGVLL